jgi:hypothetical protein
MISASLYPCEKQTLTTGDTEDTEERQEQRNCWVKGFRWLTIPRGKSWPHRFVDSHFVFNLNPLFLVSVFLRVPLKGVLK